MTTAAAFAGAIGTALVLPARSRSALLVGLALLAAAAVALAVAFVDELGGLEDASVSLSPGVVAGALAGALAIAALAAILVRFPAIVVPLLFVCAPLRPPLDPDPDALLLFTVRPDALVGYHLPLYLVLAAAALALGWRALRGEPLRSIPRRLAYPATALIGLAALSLVWSQDREDGINEVLLFWLPYGTLVAVVARAPFPDWMPRALAWVAVGLGSVFAAVGIAQFAAGDIFFSTRELAQANATTDIFRTTSLFQDPSIYGRELVVAMAVVLVALWMARLRLGIGVAALGLLGAGLLFTYSQSSMVALALVALALAVACGDRRVRMLVAGLLAAVAIAAATALGIAAGSGSVADVTRNRSTLVADTALVFAHHPVAGVGVGGQATATREEADTETSLGRSTSHTTPLTIAAELGLLGLAAYVALLVGAVLLLRDLYRRHQPLALGLGAVLLVLFAHALVYEGFFETATSWGAMAVACAALRANGEGAGPGATASSRAAGARPAT